MVLPERLLVLQALLDMPFRDNLRRPSETESHGRNK